MRVKRLRSVVHSLAHHAVSGLCFVHPHLGAHCKKLGVKEVEVGLIQPSFKPELGAVSNEITLSTQELRLKFAGLLEAEELSQNEIEKASALFQFHRGRWPSACMVEATTINGKVVQSAVGSDGHKAEILNVHS